MESRRAFMRVIGRSLIAHKESIFQIWCTPTILVFQIRLCSLRSGLVIPIELAPLIIGAERRLLTPAHNNAQSGREDQGGN
tara:strand:+ start:52043 stop:52285 length:243 start_codon:yes stop_codon:yes gene_type:complete